MVNRYVLDTNLFLRFPNILDMLDEYSLAVPSMILRELEKFENLKYRYGNQLAYEAREIRRGLNKRKDKIYVDVKDYIWDINDDYSSDYMDNCILKYCLVTGDGLITYDGLLKEKAIELNIEVVDIEHELETKIEDEYKGYVEVHMTQDELNDVYQNLDSNEWKLLHNQYLIIKDDLTDEELDAFRWDGNSLIRVTSKGFSTMNLGKFKPKDIYQQCSLDSLTNNSITMIKGRAGSGKSLISLSYAWNQVERGKYTKLVIFSNPVNAGKTSSKLGFYKGSKDEKLLDGNLGAILSSKFGDKSEVEGLILANKLVLYPFADIRGVDIQDSIVWIVEAENLDIELMKIAIQRISESSKLIIDGDYRQVDSNMFEGNNNGMKRVTDVFKGKEMYGEIELKNVYRSKIAEIADEM